MSGRNGEDPLAWRPPGLSPEPAEAEVPPALDALRARIAADLEARQGPHRRRGFFGRAWPFLAATGAGLAGMLVLSGVRSGAGLISVGLAAGGAMLALAAAGLAAKRPARAERAGQASLVVIAAALAAELWRADPGAADPARAAWICVVATLACAAVPAGLVAFGLFRSGLPARLFHVAPAAAGALALGGAAVWRHCPHEGIAHVGASHVLAPVVAAIGVGVVLRRITRPRPLAGADLPVG